MFGEGDEFSFYLKFTKQMVLNLPDAKDRAIAALWVKKLSEMNKENPKNNIYVEYLKLLLFAMQRDKLTGIFEKPPADGPIEAHSGLKTALDMIDLVKPEEIEPPTYPSVCIRTGDDLREFVAVQEIPNFGLHGYYAISSEPLSKWSNVKSNLLGLTKTLKHPELFKYAEKSAKRESEKTSLEKDEKKLKDKPDKISESKEKSQTSPAQQKMFQVMKKETADVESKPFWGINRYIERLIDETHTSDPCACFPEEKSDIDISWADLCIDDDEENFQKSFAKQQIFCSARKPRYFRRSKMTQAEYPPDSQTELDWSTDVESTRDPYDTETGREYADVSWSSYKPPKPVSKSYFSRTPKWSSTTYEDTGMEDTTSAESMPSVNIEPKMTQTRTIISHRDQVFPLKPGNERKIASADDDSFISLDTVYDIGESSGNRTIDFVSSYMPNDTAPLTRSMRLREPNESERKKAPDVVAAPRKRPMQFLETDETFAPGAPQMHSTFKEINNA